uniref:Uncharacterized protein n=1 Tax=Rhizophora mucronata TaxID=61149 RepID=A0A2P2QBP6_RHIMU
METSRCSKEQINPQNLLIGTGNLWNDKRVKRQIMKGTRGITSNTMRITHVCFESCQILKIESQGKKYHNISN